MPKIFAGLQEPLSKNREQAKALKGKNWNEIPEEDRLKGDAELGKQAFEKIERSVSIPHGNFRLRGVENLQQVDAGGMEGIESSSSPAGSASTTQLNNSQQTGQLMDGGNFAVIGDEVYLPVGSNEVDQNQYGIVQQDLQMASNIPLNIPITIGGGIAVALVGSILNNRRKYFKKSLS